MEKLYSNVMEMLYKMNYAEEMVEAAGYYTPDWWEQLQLIQEQWLFDTVESEMITGFGQSCDCLALPRGHFDLAAAETKTHTVWKNELILAAADMCIRQQHPKLLLSETVVRWKDGKLEVDLSVLEQQADTTNVNEITKL